MRTSRHCPVCGASPVSARVFVEETIDKQKLTAFSFSSRKEPEGMSHRMVQCPTCDLVYVDSPPRQDELAQAYHQANYDSSEEATDAALSYIKALAPHLRRIATCNTALEIGTGTGVFLDHLREAGFKTVLGVEPSQAAINAAPGYRREWIRESIFVEDDYPPESFDLICCFMTMEHVLDPGAIARSAMKLLRPGGAFVTVTHDYRSLVNRILGRRSPIIDIEHMQLFSATSVRALFDRSQYMQVSVEPFVNRYSLRYWTRLLPIPRAVKQPILTMVSKIGLGTRKVGLNVGNLVTVGFKPQA